MKTRFKIRISGVAVPLLVLMSGMAQVGRVWPQTPSDSQPQKPSSPATKPQAQQGANPFPEDTDSVPVLPSANSPATPAPDANGYGTAALPGGDSDPVKSPDDAGGATMDSAASDSSAGMDNLLKPPPDEEQGKHRGPGEANQPPVESAQEDESVGSYYLDQKNWKAALSRFESAVVLDPENPDVYWGLAESQRHTGDYVSAKTNYLKVMEYDPDSKHSKEAKKILKEPEMANIKAVSTTASAPAQPQ